MSEVKNFRVKGKMKLDFKLLPFTKEVRGLNEKEALEKVYSEVGSRNKLKRNRIKINSVEEISVEEAQSPMIHMIAEAGEK